MKLHEIEFKRRFSVNFHRNLKLQMGEMSFFKDWVNDKRGDPYPLVHSDGSVEEKIEGGKYSLSSVSGGVKMRLLGEFFPWATYEAEIKQAENTGVGFVLSSPLGTVSVAHLGKEIAVMCGEIVDRHPVDFISGDALAVNFYSGGFSAYIKRDGAYKVICNYENISLLSSLRKEELFRASKVFLSVALNNGGNALLSRVQFFLDCGISQADMKPVRYEDGTPLVENGKVFMSMTSRFETGGYQSIISWNYTTCEFKLEGGLFFDVGDGLWCSDIASSIIYDRTSSTWRIWVCSFSHDHILARGTSIADPRYGINVVDVTLLPTAEKGDTRDKLVGFHGDEDPDLILIDGKWHLSICRVFEEGGGYHYCHFVSDNPMDGFTFVDMTPGTQKTGGLFVPTPDGVYFVCGSDFDKRAVYDVYPVNDFTDCKNLTCDYDDGGFRGWGTVMMLPVGSRYQYVWITFDRHNGSQHNWSYGNLHVFCSETFKYNK